MKFFREDTGEIIGAYFDGEKIFIARRTENFETVEVEADGSEIEQLAEKISLACRQRAWKTSAVGFCLREDDVITYQTETAAIPEKDFRTMVKSWAKAQAGDDSKFSFAKVGAELWMEALPKLTAEEYLAAFKKFGLNLRGLSVMPVDLLAKIQPYDRTEFITEIIRNKSSPNLLARGSVWNWAKISCAAIVGILIGLAVISANLFLDYSAATDKLDAVKISVENLSEDLALKKSLDENISELHKLNKLAAQVDAPQNFNLLLNLGKIADREIRLTKIRADENLLELEGVTENSVALKNYLGRVRNSVAQSARLESSTERDDGDIAFVIRASLK